MKLIDIDEVNEVRLPEDVDDFIDNLGDFLCGMEWVTKVLREEWSSIDPVHAAGGCYCRECIHAKETVDENGKGLFCSLCKGNWQRVRPENFCGQGKPKEGGVSQA